MPPTYQPAPAVRSAPIRHDHVLRGNHVLRVSPEFQERQAPVKDDMLALSSNHPVDTVGGSRQDVLSELQRNGVVVILK